MALAVLYPSATTQAGTINRAGPDGPYSYIVKTIQGGQGVQARVSPDERDLAVTRYRAANGARAEKLIASAKQDPIALTLTFARPVSWEELVTLRKETGLTAESYTFVGSREGKVYTVIVVADQNSDIDLAWLQQDSASKGATLRGVMLVYGQVLPTPGGLGRLMSDERVYLADTTAVPVIEELKKDPQLAGKNIRVGLSSPFWGLWAQQVAQGAGSGP